MNDGTFKVGEIALLHRLTGPFKYLNGEECLIVEALAERPMVDLRGTHYTGLAYLIEYRGVPFGVPGSKLKKKPAPGAKARQEAYTVVPWSSVAWNPHKQPQEA